jgi:hypothetical protein
MKKKPSIVIQNDDGKSKNKVPFNRSKAVKNINLSETIEVCPIEITTKSNVILDSSLDDMDNLSDSDESSVKVSKRKTVTRKKTEKKLSVSDNKPQSKKTKIMPTINEPIESSPVLDDSSLDDVSNLNDIDESSVKVSKTKPISRNKKDIKTTSPIQKTQKKKLNNKSTLKFNDMTTVNGSGQCNSIPKKKKDHNVVSDSSIISGKVESSSSSVVSSIDQPLVVATTLNAVIPTSEENNGMYSHNIVSDSSIISVNVDIPSRSVVPSTEQHITVSTSSSAVITSTVETNNGIDDIGINIADIAVNIPNNTANVSVASITSNSQKLPEALLRCAFIQNSNSQTVVFWCEELTKWSFKCQNKIMTDIREGKNWVTREIPFATQGSEPPFSLYLHRNNVAVKGLHGTFGIRLFHYTLRTNFQTELNMKNTARRIVRYANEDCKANLVFDENRLFLYKKPCVWSNLIGKKGALDKFVRDTNEVLNGRYSLNPKLWDNHTELIKKFFFVNKLQPDVAELLNAPLENIDDCIERTAELVASVSQRRNGAVVNSTSEVFSEIDIDPENEFPEQNVISNSTQYSSGSNNSHNQTEDSTEIVGNNTETPEVYTEIAENNTENPEDE